jgi:hypothetical protein
MHVSHHGLPGSYHTSLTSSSLISPTPAPKITVSGIRANGKENGKPELPAGLHIRRPAPLTPHVFPSQIFYDDSFNPLYNHAYAQTFGYGDPQLTFKDNMKPSGFSSSFNGDFRPTTTMTQTTQPQSRTTITGTTEGGSSGSGPDNGIHFDM